MACEGERLQLQLQLRAAAGCPSHRLTRWLASHVTCAHAATTTCTCSSAPTRAAVGCGTTSSTSLSPPCTSFRQAQAIGPRESQAGPRDPFVCCVLQSCAMCAQTIAACCWGGRRGMHTHRTSSHLGYAHALTRARPTHVNTYDRGARVRIIHMHPFPS
jgi:hypothetical protein